MTARSFGEVLGRLAPTKRFRTYQPVRRDSLDVADPRSTSLWQPLGQSNGEARRVIAARLQAAEYYDRANKQPGKCNGPLGAIGLEVLRELYRIVDFRTGRLEPALATICARLRRSRQAVHDALKRLKEHGFLVWVRRSEPTGFTGAGPQVRQVTNAYALSVPASANEWVQKCLGGGPLPDCELTRLKAHATEVEAMLASTSIENQVGYLVGESPLADVLQRIGATVKANERESTIQGETNL